MEQQEEILLEITQDVASEPKKKSPFMSFVSDLDALKDLEEKIRFSLQFMQQCLSREGPPAFKEFWEARKLCLTLFKENLNPKARSQLWEKYIGLTSEAYHLKDMMDSESSFAKEQIESAIKALENNIQNVATLFNQVHSLEIPGECDSILSDLSQYNSWHRELHLMHSFAEQIHALRKEVLKTEMRFRFKNKLLDQLTKIGDFVFPRRKELSEHLCSTFLADIEKYMSRCFSRDLQEATTFVLKDTIKALQYVIKQLYFNNEAFAKAKNLLSECWEKIQVKDKERKGEFSKQKELRRSNHEQISKKIQELEERYSNGGLQEKDLDGEYDQLQLMMRNLDLGRDEIKSIKHSFQQIKNRFTEKLEKEIKEKKKINEEIENQRYQHFLNLKSEIQSLLNEPVDLYRNKLKNREFDKEVPQNFDLERVTIAHEQGASEGQNFEVKPTPSKTDSSVGFGIEQLQKKFMHFEAEKQRLTLSDDESVILSSLLRQMKQNIFDKRQEHLFSLGDLELSDKLTELLNDRKKMRQELKKELESLRKASGGSGLDFEKAMQFRDLLENGKQLLDKMETSIIEIEEKMFDIES